MKQGNSHDPNSEPPFRLKKRGPMRARVVDNLFLDSVKDSLYTSEALAGRYEWAIESLESGEAIGPQFRKFLVAHLRGEVKKPKGNKRTLAAKTRDLGLLVNVVALMCERQITENAAINLLVEADATERKRHPLLIDTARSMIKRAKDDAPSMRPLEIDGKQFAPWSKEARVGTVGEELARLLTKTPPK